METTTAINNYPFLRNGGEMGERTRTYNWAGSALGTPDTWPQGLRTTLGILLHSALPMMLLWGDDHTYFYNDAARPNLGNDGKHPALGKRGAEVWADAWHSVEPLLKQVKTSGESVFSEDQLVPVFRNGRMEDAYWTFSYSPAYNDDGQIGGVFVTCAETTEKVVNTKLQQEKSRLLQAVFDSSAAGISVVSSVRDEQGEIIDFEYQLANRVTEQINNRTDLVGKRYLDLHPTYKEAGLFDDFVQAINTGQPVEHERQYTGGGFDVWYQTISVKLDDGILLTFRDVTNSVQARQQRERDQQQLLDSFEQAPVGIAVISEENLTFRVVNAFYATLVGRTPDELIDKSLLEALPELQGQGFEQLLENVLDTGISYTANEVAVQLVRRNQLETIYFNFTYQPQRGPNNRIANILIICVDVTAQVLARQQIQESEERFRTMAEDSGILIAVSDAAGRSTYLNQAWVELTGRSVADLLNRGWVDLVHPDDREPFLNTYQSALQKQASFSSEFRILNQYGNYRWLLVNCPARFHPDGTFEGYISSCIDFTERKQAEAALRQSREQQAFLLQLTDQLRVLTDPAEIQYRAACVLGEYVGASRVGYAEDQNDGQHVMVTRNYTSGVPGIEGRYQYSDYGAALMAELQAGRRVVRPDIASDDNLNEAEKEAHAVLQLGATVNLPLMKAGRMTAILFLHYNGPHVFSEGELTLLNETAERTWEAVERARIANALQTSEAKLRSLVTAAPVAIGLLVGRDLVIDLPNQTFIDIVGKGPDIAGKPLREVMPELITENQPFLQILNDVYTTGQMFQSFDSQVDIVRQGVLTHSYYNITYSPLYNEAGEVYAILDVSVDVTGQILAQQELAQQKSYLQNAVDIADLGTFEIDVATQIGQFSDKVGQWFGLTLPSKPVANFLAKVHPDDQAMVWQALDGSMQDERQSRHDITYRIADAEGATTHHLRSIGKTRYAAGQPQTISGMIQDVTPQIQARQKIEQSEARFQSLIRQASVGIVVLIGEEVRVELVNDAYAQLIGRSREDLIGKPLFSIVPEFESPFRDLLDNVRNTGEPLYLNETPYAVQVNGVKIDGFLNMIYQPYREYDDTIIGVTAFCQDVTEQVLARQKVEESEARFRSLVEEAPVATSLFVGNDLTIDIANETMLGYWGKGNGVMNRPLAEVLPELNGQPFLDQLADIMATGQTYADKAVRAELVVNGVLSTYYFDYTYKPIRNATGQVYAVLDTAIDVTEQVLARQKIERTQAELLETNQRLSLALDAGNLGSFILERETGIMLCTPQCKTNHGQIPDAAPSSYEGLIDMILPDDQAAVAQAMTYAFEHQTVYQVEYRVWALDGSMRWLRASGQPIRVADGPATRMVGITQNVTEQVLARQRIEESEATLRGAIELAELGTWELDAATGVVSYSDRIKTWFGYNADSPVLNEDYNPIHERDRNRIAAAVSAALQPGSPGSYDEEYTMVDQQTEAERIIHAQGKTFIDRHGNPVKISGTAQDVTQDRRREQELERQVQERTRQLQESVHDLERSNANLQQFAYVASHDLQEPLRKIQSFGDVLVNQYSTQLGEGADLLQRMQQSASRMSTLIKDLLAYSRIATRQDTSIPVALSAVVAQVLSDLELVIEETSALITVGDLPIVAGDPVQLGQLMQNLLSNALKFQRTGNRPQITVLSRSVAIADLPADVRPLREVPYYHRLDVTDNGIGFDEKYVDRIFQVFQRLHGRGQYVGTGIGLAICEKVAANHGGTITATSQPGQGATFSVFLPQ